MTGKIDFNIDYFIRGFCKIKSNYILRLALHLYIIIINMTLLVRKEQNNNAIILTKEGEQIYGY